MRRASEVCLPFSRARLTISLSSNLQEHAKRYYEQGARPSGVLKVSESMDGDAFVRLTEMMADKGGVESAHRIWVMTGDADFKPISFPLDDQQFLQQRELSAREVARIFRIPSHMIDAATGDSLIYPNTQDQKRFFLDYSIKPWCSRIEAALSNDAHLASGGTYCSFDFSGLLRANQTERYAAYKTALESEFLTLTEVREAEDLPPLEAT